MCLVAASFTGEASALEVGRPAPPLLGREWLNSKPLAAADLRGKVVLVEFWTFACINCRRTIPAMRRLHATYGATGDVAIVGVHTPELDLERDPRAVRRAVARLGIGFPVVIDDQARIWKAFENHYWPALYLIDRRGVVRDVHIGELHEGTPGWRAWVEKMESLRRERV